MKEVTIMITFLILFLLVLIIAIVTIVECGVILGVGILLFGDIFICILILMKIFKKKKK